MSQVIPRDLKIVGLKNQNKNLENVTLKKEEERKYWECKCKDLLDKNEKLMNQVTGRLHVQGAKHIIWDMIIVEATQLRPYLDYILDKEIVIQAARHNVAAVKEVLNKNPIDTANNTISFFNGFPKDDMKRKNIKDI